jgi:phosphoglycolate phosphatase
MSMPTAKFEAVLFDLDGTLLDTSPDFITALNRLMAAKNQPAIDATLIRAAVTNGSAGLITLGFGLEPGHRDFEPLRQQFLDIYYHCLADNTRLFPGMEALLAKLAERAVPWGIVTNKPARFTNAILERLWLPRAPGTVICPDHVLRTKPDPEPVLLACNQLAIAPHKVLLVGDHLRDIQSGRNAGCQTVSAAYGFIEAADDPALWGGHYLVNHASELESIIFAHSAHP